MLMPRSIEVDGAATAALASADCVAPLVFLSGGIPGLTPYCSGPHIWGAGLDALARERAVLAFDLGLGAAGAPDAGIGVDTLVDQMRAILAAQGVARCHMIAHDLAGLIALLLATESPTLVRAVSVVSSGAAAPSGDGVDNLCFAHPPLPQWGRAAQRWALERVSYSHQHIDGALLDACVAASAAAAQRTAAPAMSTPPLADVFMPSLAAAKARLYETCRGAGVPVPVQIIWGTHDPLATLEQGLALYQIIAARQPATQFHVLNRAGSLPFREEPETFLQVVRAFGEVVFPG